jgi:penicillin-binding protein 1B
MKKLSLITFVKLAIGLILASTCAVVLWVVATLSSLPLETFADHGLVRDSTHLVSALEEGAIVQGDELAFYALFTDERWDMAQAISDGQLVSADGLSYVPQQDIVLPAMGANQCQDIYCFQQRLAFEKIPSIFWRGLIGIEDSRFTEHIGIDLIGIARALIHDLSVMRLEQGASTITQQLVKNLYFTNDKKFERKFKEIIVALYLEWKYPKEKILEAYLNEINWGSFQGIRIRGIHAASTFLFGKRPEDVDSFEASIIIGMLKGPYYYGPINNLDRLKSRTGVVYKRLIEMKLIPDDVKLVWSEKRWEKWRQSLVERSREGFYRSLWLASVDPSDALSSYEKFIFIHKAVVLEEEIKKKTGRTDFGIKIALSKINSEEQWEYYSKYERSKLKAIHEERHQVGSTLKPIAYGIYTELGLNLDDEVETAEIPLDLKSGRWSPGESHRVEEKTVTLKKALLDSLNRPVIRLANDLGFEQVEAALLRYLPELKRPLSEYPAQLLGSVELTLSELMLAYKTFIADQCRVHGNEDDNSILFALSNPEETTVRRVVGERLKNMRFFGKTGTSNMGWDTWYVFFDGLMYGVIWVGYEGKREGKDLLLYGSGTSFRIFQGYLQDRGRRPHELSCQMVQNQDASIPIVEKEVSQ